MTKEDKIKEAWMDLNIEAHFVVCDKTGWYHGYFCNGIDDITSSFGNITDKIDYEIEYDGVGKFRPKSLKGIENNNGWIKIESENDLPKEKGLKCLFLCIHGNTTYISDDVLEDPKWFANKYSHWRFKYEIKDPIY